MNTFKASVSKQQCVIFDWQLNLLDIHLNQKKKLIILYTYAKCIFILIFFH